MLKRFVLIVAVLAALSAFTSPALAHQGVPTTYYVDTAYTGTEVGTPAQPFNTLDEAVAASQAQPYGGYIYTKISAGAWAYYGYVAPVYPGDTGRSLSGPALIALLAVLSLILVLAGGLLLRRSRTRYQQS